MYAHRGGDPEYEAVGSWLEEEVNGDRTYGISELVLSGFIRVVTHPRLYVRPTPLADAIEFAARLRERPNCVAIDPGPRHWEIFSSLCERTDARGNRVPDAYLAALAIESGSEWITLDRGFSRYAGLRWRHPLEGA